jgi:hypothetical protein
MFRATDLAYESNDRSAQLGMELVKAYPPEARLKSWRRTVRLDRTSNVVEINDSYFLTQPVSDITLNLMTACTVTETGRGRLTLTSAQGAPPTLISFDPNLLTPTVETIPLENAELKRNWGNQSHRIPVKDSRRKNRRPIETDHYVRSRGLSKPRNERVPHAHPRVRGPKKMGGAPPLPYV